MMGQATGISAQNSNQQLPQGTQPNANAAQAANVSYGATKLGESITNIEVGSKSKLQTSEEAAHDQQAKEVPAQARSGEPATNPDKAA